MRFVLPILFCVFSNCIAFGSGEELIRQQFAEYSIQKAPNEVTVLGHLKNISKDGTWADIDYTSQRRGEWPTREHLDRLKEMAACYVDRESIFYKKESMKRTVLAGLNHWIEEDYQNSNWFNGRIGVPYRLGAVLLLMGDAVPEEMLRAVRPILCRSELGLTGQNKVWCAGIGVMKGVLYDDQELVARAVEDIWSELRVSMDEGIQADWSFHQHGPQQQFGNYGLSFGEDMLLWATVLRDTQYALSGERLEVLRNYLLEGASWILWRGRMDFSGLGRHVDEGSQASKYWRLVCQLKSMELIDPKFKKAYDTSAELVGFKPFWRSDMAVQRRPDWYASIKMSSTRVVGAESCNSENMLGLHQGDGVLLTYVAGDEYEDIMPLWDWKRLPGTTCDQDFDQLQPKTLEEYGGADFAGALSAGNSGVAAMIYKRKQLTAQKAWFFLEDHIVCLGAVISGETQGNVITSVEQSWLSGEVKQVDDWVWHNNVGYQFLDGRPEVEASEVEGNWNATFPTRGDRPVSGKVFSLWIDHGKSPEEAGYGYRIFPRLSAVQMAAMEPSQIFSNSSKVQAVENDGVLYAVFYEAGKLELGLSRVVEVSAPCLLIIQSGNMLVADPTHSPESLEITLDGQRHRVQLPQGAQLGRQVEVEL